MTINPTSLNPSTPDLNLSKALHIDLPEDILSIIFNELSLKNLHSVGCVQKWWNKTASKKIVEIQSNPVIPFIKTLANEMHKLRVYQPAQDLKQLVLGSPFLVEGKNTPLRLQESIVCVLEDMDFIDLKIFFHKIHSVTLPDEFKNLFEWAEMRNRLMNAKKILSEHKITQVSELINHGMKVSSDLEELKITLEELRQKIDSLSLPLEARIQLLLILGQPLRALKLTLENEKTIKNFKELLERIGLDFVYTADSADTHGMNVDQAVSIAKRLDGLKSSQTLYCAIIEKWRESGDYRRILTLRRAYLDSEKKTGPQLQYDLFKNFADYQLCLCNLVKDEKGIVPRLEEAVKGAADLQFSEHKNHVFSLIAEAFLTTGHLDRALHSLSELDHEPQTIDQVIDIHKKVFKKVREQEKSMAKHDFKATLNDLRGKIQFFLSKKELFLSIKSPGLNLFRD